MSSGHHDRLPAATLFSRWWGRFKWFLSAILLGAAVYSVAVMWAHYKLQGVVFFDWGQTTSTELVRFEIGRHRFAIPMNYLYNRKSWRGGKTVGVNFEALLPDFKANTRSVYKKPSENLISFLLHIGPYRRIVEIFRAKKDSPFFAGELAPAPDAPGLMYVADPYPEGRELYAHFINGHADYFALCNKAPPGYPSGCSARLDYSDEAYVSYSFRRQHLANWKTIDHGVRKLIESFERAAQ